MNQSKLRISIKKNTNFSIHLMASYSILLLVMLFMGIYLYSISLQNIQSGIREQNKTILHNSIEQLDMDFISMANLTSQMANNSKLVRLSNMDDLDNGEFYLLAYQAKAELSKFLPSHMLLPIDSYFIRLKKTDYLLSFDHFEYMEHYYSKNRLLDAGMFERWKDMLNNPDHHYELLPLTPYVGTYSTNPYNYYYLMSLEDFSFKNIPADICFELNMEKINQIFSELNLYENGYICVADQEGNPVFTIGSDQKPLQEGIWERLSRLSALPYDTNGFSSYHLDHANMLVTSDVSNRNQWVYYLVQPENSAFYSISSYQFVFFLCVCTALIMGFVLIFLLSKRNSRPLVDMDQKLEQSRLRQQELLNLAKQQEPLLRTSYIRQIMRGTISSPEEMDYVRDYLKLEAGKETCKYLVLYCNIYLNKYEVNTSASTVVGIAATDYDAIIKEALALYFGNPLYLYSPQDRSYALLLLSEKKEEGKTVSDFVETAFTTLHHYLMNQHSIWIFGGIGNRNEELNFTWKSYQQAKEAIRYTTNEHFFCCYESLNQDSNHYYYPAALSNQLTSFVEAGNKQQIAELFKLIKKENLIKRSMPYNQMNWLLSDIRNTLVKVRFTIPPETATTAVLDAMDLHFEEMPSLKLYEDLAVEICELMRADTSENQLISSIKQYISQHYRDPALCLSKISDEFSISESYFSYLFKKTTGENFSTYLEMLRMKQATYLIKETKNKISDLYLELGYNNPNSFRRAFKKIYGVSPATIRENARSELKNQNKKEEELKS